MIDLANYPMLPSLSHTTRGRRYGGNQRSLCCVPHSWCYMTIHEPGVKGEEEISAPVMAVRECDCSGNDFNDACSPSSSSPCVENEFGGDVVSRSSPAEHWCITVAEEVGTKELSEAQNVSGRDYCHNTWSSLLSTVQTQSYIPDSDSNYFSSSYFFP